MAKLELSLLELLERQRLSRFDTVMFLAYPLVILGMTVLPNAFLQYQALQNISIMGVTLDFILVAATIAFVLGLVLGVVRFVVAYIGDDLIGRIWAARHLILMTGILGIELLLMFFWSPIRQLAEIGFTQTGNLISDFYTAALGMTFLLSWRVVTTRLTIRIVRWFEMSFPLTLRSGQASLEKLRRKYVYDEGSGGIGFVVKLSWCVACMGYGLMAARAIWADGLHGIAAYHIAFLIALAVAALVIGTRKKFPDC